MKNIIQFHVYKGEKYFVASGVDLPVVSQGLTLDELVRNVKEAVELHLEGEKLDDWDLGEKPQILINLEVSPEVTHA